jgi:hypothetical protein
MKSSELKALIESQRYMIISLYTSLNMVETDNQVLEIMKTNLDTLWESTEMVNESFKLGAKTLDQIVQHGKEVVALQKLYNLSDYDKSKVN